MRTLIVSDLHLGSRLERDVLRRGPARAALLEALQDVDRLVLLGDVVELLEGRPRTAMRIAEPVLRDIGAVMGRGRREIVVVPGNHDHQLIRPWLRERRRAGGSLGHATRVPVSSSVQLSRLCSWLKPAKVQVRYPGVWVADGVWATHGHYLDRHLIPPGTGGLPARFVGKVPPPHAVAWDYETSAGASPAALQGLLASSLPAVVGEPLDRAASIARRASFAMLPLAAALLGEGKLAPLSAGALGFQFRRAGLPAMASVVKRLRVPAEHVIFGHVHRGGPRIDDDPDNWASDSGRRLWNTGCWVYEPLLLAGAEPPHSYWPGGAVVVQDGQEPEAIALLDGVATAALR